MSLEHSFVSGDGHGEVFVCLFIFFYFSFFLCLVFGKDSIMVASISHLKK